MFPNVPTHEPMTMTCGALFSPRRFNEVTRRYHSSALQAKRNICRRPRLARRTPVSSATAARGGNQAVLALQTVLNRPAPPAHRAGRAGAQLLRAQVRRQQGRRPWRWKQLPLPPKRRCCARSPLDAAAALTSPIESTQHEILRAQRPRVLTAARRGERARARHAALAPAAGRARGRA